MISPVQRTPALQARTATAIARRVRQNGCRQRRSGACPEPPEAPNPPNDASVAHSLPTAFLEAAVGIMGRVFYRPPTMLVVQSEGDKRARTSRGRSLTFCRKSSPKQTWRGGLQV